MLKKGFYLDYCFDWSLVRIIPSVEIFSNSISLRLTLAWLPFSLSLVYVRGEVWNKECPSQ